MMICNEGRHCPLCDNSCELYIEVEPVRYGRWVDRIVDENEVIQPWMERYYCSECLDGVNQSWFKFCPNCGARMDRG